MSADTTSTRPTPRAFISYSWDDDAHKQWVLAFATRLRTDGVEVTLDQWHLQPGDQLPAFMERAIHDNDYILIVCTPYYAERSNRRVGGVGYEGDIMTGEVFSLRNERKFIPIFRSGPNWLAAAPSWLTAKYRIDLREDPYPEQHYADLFHTLHGTRPTAPPVVPRVAAPAPASTDLQPFTWEPVHILNVIVDEVIAPRNDGSRGSALYRIPFQLSRSPTRLWCDLFVRAWDHPSSYTTRHRPGIARVEGDRIVLNRTTIEEVAEVHRDTLVLALAEANQKMTEIEADMFQQELQKKREQEEHERRLRETAAGIAFE
jgi:hypothetical protein